MAAGVTAARSQLQGRGDGAIMLWSPSARHEDPESEVAELPEHQGPGDGFGDAYGRWARLCFTSVPRDRLLGGIARLRGAIEDLAR